MLRKNRNALTLVSGLIIAACGATPALAQTLPPTSGALYDINFEDPPHKAGSQPTIVTGPAPRNGISRINFGDPTVVDGFGALTSQVLRFDASNSHDQIALNMDDFANGVPSTGFYVVKSDILIACENADFFSFFIDAPRIRRIAFKTDGTVQVIQPPFTNPPTEVPIGTYACGARMTLQVEVDLGTDSWEIFLDGVSLYAASFGIADEDIAGVPLNWRTIRFAQNTQINSSFAAIDNVLVTAAFGPTPPAALLECSLSGAALEEFNNRCAAAGNGVLFVMDPDGAGSGTAGCLCPGVVSFVCVDGSADPCVGDPSIRLSDVSEASLRRGQMGFNTHQSFTYCSGNGADRECRVYYFPH